MDTATTAQPQPAAPAAPPLAALNDEVQGFCYDDAPLLSAQWFIFYDCREHRQCGLPCIALKDPRVETSVCGGKPVFRALLKRVIADNFHAFRTVEALNTDPAAMGRWVTFLASEVLMAWEKVFDREGRPVEATQERKEALLLKWNAFRMWVWQRSIGEESYRGNFRDAGASPDGGERAAA